MTDHIATASPWMTKPEASAYLKINPRTLDRYVKAGKIRQHKVAGTQSVRFNVADLDAAVIPDEDLSPGVECCSPEAVPAGAHIDQGTRGTLADPFAIIINHA